MMHKGWCGIEEVSYYLSRSSIKFQGHRGREISDLAPISASNFQVTVAEKSHKVDRSYQIHQICLMETHSQSTSSDQSHPIQHPRTRGAPQPCSKPELLQLLRGLQQRLPVNDGEMALINTQLICGQFFVFFSGGGGGGNSLETLFH